MSPTPNQITKTFKEQVDDLIQRGIAANQQEIVNELGWHKAGMSQAMNLSKNVPIAVYRKFTERYKLRNPEQSNGTDASYGAVNDPQGYREEVITLLRDKVKTLEGQLSLAQAELREIALVNQALLMTNQDILIEMTAKSGRGLQQSLDKWGKVVALHYEKAAKRKGSLA